MSYTRVQQKVLEILSINPKHISPKGWLTTKEECPWCGKKDYHFGVKFQPKSQSQRNEVSFNCFKCGVTGGEYLLFRQLGLLDFLQQGDYIKQALRVEKKISRIPEPAQTLEAHTPNRALPIGFKRVKSHTYLKNRGFEDWQFDQYSIGITRLTFSLRDYVIFSILEDGENKAYVARLAWDKDKILKEEAKGRKIPRYKNEGGADFAKLLFGIDELDEQTRYVILVEGVTDKANIDRLLRRLGLLGIYRCCCTFGKKISEIQIMKLYNRSVRNVIFMYDPDAVAESKRHSFNASRIFESVKVAFLREKDPGDLSLEEFSSIIDNLESPISFMVNRVQKRNL